MDTLVVPNSAEDKPKRKLLDQVRDVVRLKHYSLRTERTYCDWIERFIRFHGMRHPGEMAEPELGEFLTDLARASNVSASTQNQALSALLFLKLSAGFAATRSRVTMTQNYCSHPRTAGNESPSAT
jgi:Phage integrase, N-terminal SAM-like domain